MDMVSDKLRYSMNQVIVKLNALAVTIGIIADGLQDWNTDYPILASFEVIRSSVSDVMRYASDSLEEARQIEEVTEEAAEP